VTEVRRYDSAPLGSATRTTQGFLRAPARLTRTGILTYRRADGSVRKELRRPEQVFAAESLSTLGDAPVTDLHPSEMVSAENARQLGVGHVSQSTVRQDGQFVEASIVVTDAKIISAIEQGDRKEVSCGYSCRLIEKPGVWQGQRYDAEQTDITYNHVALGPKNWGRAGSDVAIRLDDGDAIVDVDDASNTSPQPVPRPEEKRMDMIAVRVDGIEAQVPKEWAQLIGQALEKRDGKIAGLNAQVEQLNKDVSTHSARADSLQNKLDSATEDLKKATDPKEFEKALRVRFALVDRVRKIVGKEAKLDGKSPRELMELAIQHQDSNADLSTKADAYVEARFDMLDPEKGEAERETHRRVRDISNDRAQQQAQRSDEDDVYERAPWLVPLENSKRRVADR